MGRDLYQEGSSEWWIDYARWPGPDVIPEFKLEEGKTEIRITPRYPQDFGHKYEFGDLYMHPDTGNPVGIIVGVQRDPFMFLVRPDNGPV